MALVVVVCAGDQSANPIIIATVLVLRSVCDFDQMRYTTGNVRVPAHVFVVAGTFFAVQYVIFACFIASHGAMMDHGVPGTFGTCGGATLFSLP